MTFLLMRQMGNGGPYWQLLSEENGHASPVAVVYDEQLATRVRDLLNRHGTVDVALLTTPPEPGPEPEPAKETP